MDEEVEEGGDRTRRVIWTVEIYYIDCVVVYCCVYVGTESGGRGIGQEEEWGVGLRKKYIRIVITY